MSRHHHHLARGLHFTRQRYGHRTKVPTGLSVRLSIAVIIMLLGTTAQIVYLSGGAPNVAVHAFYVPIVFAAARFNWRGAALTALAAGTLAGPLMPVDTATGDLQTVTEWGIRLAAFVTIGLLVASLTKEASRSFPNIIIDAFSTRALRSALERRELVAHYQPIVDLRTSRVVGFEALCRWSDPIRGAISPDEFIPLAERSGADIPIGQLMLGCATTQTAAWLAGGMRDLIIAVNVSANHVCHPEFVAHITDALASAGLRAENLCVEITESAIIHDHHRARTNITRIHDLGVLISLDDFGTGQSSLAYLQEFPIDIIKIDKAFVSRVDSDPKCAALVLAIIQMANALGATTIGEGIERPGQLHALQALGCSQGQGYLLGRPGPAPDARTLSPGTSPIHARG